ncbi:MAG: hypothetical protein ACWGMZ_10850, partial [Thermoguttaceae bacterium]
MLFQKKALLLGVCVAVVVGFAWGRSFGQSIGRAALAARQHIKAQVLKAMADKKIDALERQDILAGAKEILSPSEYMGLVCTIDRLSPPQTRAKHEKMTPNYSMPKNAQAATPSIRRFLRGIPYIDPSQLKIQPSTAMLPKMHYVNPPRMKTNFATEADKVVAKIPRLYDLYIDPPHWGQERVAYNKIHKTKAKTLAVKEHAQKKVVVKTVAKQPKLTQTKTSVPAKSQGELRIAKKTVTETKAKNRPVVSKAKTTLPAKQQAKSKLAEKTKAIDPKAENTKTTNSSPVTKEKSKVKLVGGEETQAVKEAEMPRVLPPPPLPPHIEKVSLQSPAAKLLKKGESQTILSVYTEYGAPVLNTPAGALLEESNKPLVLE